MATRVGLTLVVSVDLRRPLLATRAFAFVQTDSSAALGVARTLAGHGPATNNLAAELGLRLGCMGCTLQDKHLRNTLSVEADALCRLTQGSSVPVCLQHMPRVHPPVRGDSWFVACLHPRNCVILRVTSHVTAPCCLHSTTSRRLSHGNCCFAAVSSQIK